MSNRILGLTPQGELYEFGRCRVGDTELAGPTFSRWANLFRERLQTGYDPRHLGTFHARQRGSPAPDGLCGATGASGPELTGELAEAAERLGMSALEAAAYDRLAVPLA